MNQEMHQNAQVQYTGADFGFLKRIKTEHKYAFVATFIFGLLIHAYKFLNYLPNHDSLFNFYSNQNVLASGRWFLSVACGIGSYFDLPWVNGVLSLFYVSIATVLIVSLFEVKNKVSIIVLSALFAAFPSVTEIFFFGFTADGYMAAMLLSVVGVYVLRFENKSLKYCALSVICICLACGIYQAYISFSLLLAIFYLVFIILKRKDCTVRSLWMWVLKFAVCVAVALAAYYAIWKLCMLVQHVTPTSYQGIDSVGFSGFDSIVLGIKNSAESLFIFFFEWNILKHGITLYGILNIAVFVVFVISLVVSIKQSRVYKEKEKLLLILLCLMAIPFAATIWSFASPDVAYGIRMLHCIVLLFAFPVILCENYLSRETSNAIVCVFLVLIMNFAVSANIAYFYLDMEYESTYSEALEMREEIEAVRQDDLADAKILVIGRREEIVALDENGPASRIHLLSSRLEQTLLLDGAHVSAFLQNVLYYDGEFIEDEELLSRVQMSDTFQAMPNWPEPGSVAVIDETVVVKLNDHE